ncbi:C45 family autoproteolytic acyltransferase/hydolase [Burkholderia cepacia]|uniref:C45 family autoproteolytic acyltransferase/hydolase n=1 Tax=Burkholderia cepacia TaxID=292 RepID=UPI0007C80FFB|nr:C45 family peptidase [Burkholderia cepacia]
MRCTFEAISEDMPGQQWGELFNRYWPAYRQWFLRDGDRARPSYLMCRKALRDYMPELLPTWARLSELAGGGDLEARFLSMWGPPPYISGCSQAVWLPSAETEAGQNWPVLLRNYDFSPALLEGVWLASRWHGQRVLGVSDCLWGVLDGINECGLAASLSFGGRQTVGHGFGIPIVLRYLLEFAENVDDAIRMLSRIPVHMSYSVTLLDRHGHWATVYVAPDRPAESVRKQAVSNLQHAVEWPAHANATHAEQRADALMLAVRQAADYGDVLRALLRPPLFQTSYGRGYGTLYTTIYHPHDASVEMVWPDLVWGQSCARFTPGIRVMEFDIDHTAPPYTVTSARRWILNDPGSFQ